MSKITYEEANLEAQSIMNELMGYSHENYDGSEIQGLAHSTHVSMEQVVYPFIEQHKPPTWEEVVKVWEEAIGDKLDFITNDEGIRVILPNKTYYLINKEQVYSNRAVFSMNVNATLYAINLTIRYLQAREKNNDK